MQSSMGATRGPPRLFLLRATAPTGRPGKAFESRSSGRRQAAAPVDRRVRRCENPGRRREGGGEPHREVDLAGIPRPAPGGTQVVEPVLDPLCPGLLLRAVQLSLGLPAGHPGRGPRRGDRHRPAGADAGLLGGRGRVHRLRGPRHRQPVLALLPPARLGSGDPLPPPRPSHLGWLQNHGIADHHPPLANRRSVHAQACLPVGGDSA
jgi:hypothetical protein